MSYRVYLLQNDQGTRYIGITDDVGRRINDHNEGKSKWTAPRRPWRLIWQSPPLKLGQARKLENRLKRQKGGIGLDSALQNVDSLTNST
jgi:putative endonuclease